MGAQVYEEEIARRAPEALKARGAGWSVERIIVRPMRSSLSGTHRIPLGRVAAWPSAPRRVLGATLYPRGSIVHRMSLELPPGPGINVVTLHDVVAWKYPDESRPVSASGAELRRAEAVICVSEFTAAEAVDRLGVANPVVIHNGVDEAFFDAPVLERAQLQGLGVRLPYILAAGGASQRKNLEALAEAWPIVHARYPDLSIVLAGPAHPRRTALFRGLSNVILVGRVDSRMLPGLFAGAAAMVIPSLYEGFGLPALEAMAARVPVVASARSSLPEVVGDAGLLVEPQGTALAAGLIDVLAGSADVQAMVRRGRMRASLFTWERSAGEHAAVWASLS